MFCSRCGNDLSAGARYCSRCGERVHVAVAETPRALPPYGQDLAYDPLSVDVIDVPPPPGFYYWPPRRSVGQPVGAAASMQALPPVGYPAAARYPAIAPYMRPQFIESQYPPQLLVTATPARRLAGFALDWLIAICTLGVGWLIWFCVVAPNGQTPAKQLLDMYVLREDGTRAGGGVTWVRQFLVKGFFMLLNVLTVGLVGLIAALWCLGDNDRRCLWDKLGGTYVAYSPQKFKPATAHEIAQSHSSSGPFPELSGY